MILNDLFARQALTLINKVLGKKQINKQTHQKHPWTG